MRMIAPLCAWFLIAAAIDAAGGEPRPPADAAGPGKSAPGRAEFLVGDHLEAEGGQWNPGQSPLEGPFGVDFDSAGSMYIVELTTGRLHRRLRSGEIETLRAAHPAGYGGDRGPVSGALFNGPHNCIVADGKALLVADSWNHCVRQIDLATMQVATIAGTGGEGFSGDGGPARSAAFNFVMCIALDEPGKTLHITDLKNLRIRNMDLATGLVTTVAGNGSKGVPTDGAAAVDSPLVDPRAAASDGEGNLYVLERSGHALRLVRPDGSIRTVAGTGEKGFRDGQALQTRFGSPKHLCCDPAGNVYIADDLNGAIRKFDPRAGRVSTVLGRGFGDPRITLEHPHGVRWHEGWLYVVDTGHNRILRIPAAAPR